MNFFQKYHHILKYVYAVLFGIIGGLLVYKTELLGPVAIMALPVVIIFFFYFIKEPKIGIYTAFISMFWVATVGRYVPINIPMGLATDIFLVLTFVALLFRDWKKIDLSGWNHIFSLLMINWMLLVILEIANPLALSIEAWFYAMRGLALYQMLVAILCFSLFRDRKDFVRFIKIWVIFSMIGALWGIKQKFFGVDSFEAAWLAKGAYKQHLLFGKLRVFSYYTDAGIFGPAMGQLTIFFGILFLGPFSWKKRLIFIGISLVSFYCMIISGTRGALAVPAAGGLLYLIMIRNRKLLISGLSVMIMGFVFLKYTSIGSGNYDIQRLRTALDPEDASLNVRLKNREMLRNYLVGKPFGTGIGSAGFWGQRFTPWTWMANFPTDGLYTRVRAETGVVGYTIYVYTWLFILVYGVWQTWQYKDPKKRYFAMAALANFAGILLASYGNEVLNQIPVNFATLIPLTFVFTMKYWDDKDGTYRIPEERKHKIFK